MTLENKLNINTKRNPLTQKPNQSFNRKYCENRHKNSKIIWSDEKNIFYKCKDCGFIYSVQTYLNDPNK